MDAAKKIKMSLTYAGMTQMQLAAALNTSSANISQRMKRGSFTIKDMEQIADAMGAALECYIVFPDGTKI